METSLARDATPPDRLTTKTVAKDETMTIDGVHLRLLHWAPAHTSGDLVVYLPDQKIVFAEDLLVTDRPIPTCSAMASRYLPRTTPGRR
jgi:glyoxylase-like metal-dependent hydrolase (beta-lactamase superfamily II)